MNLLQPKGTGDGRGHNPSYNSRTGNGYGDGSGNMDGGGFFDGGGGYGDGDASGDGGGDGDGCIYWECTKLTTNHLLILAAMQHKQGR